jgi:hypothetical protein
LSIRHEPRNRPLPIRLAINPRGGSGASRSVMYGLAHSRPRTGLIPSITLAHAPYEAIPRDFAGEHHNDPLPAGHRDPR